MKEIRWALWLLLAMLIPATVMAAESKQPRVKFETSQGTIVIQLNAKAAPITVKNFLTYVKTGFYDGTVFHRVIKGFMFQGGGLTADMHPKRTGSPIPNEAGNGLKNLAGTIAMARTSDPDSATSQFFINTADNTFLDHKADTAQGWGYCVFGRVVSGMNVVSAIEAQPTHTVGPYRNVPVTPVVFIKAVVVP